MGDNSLIFFVSSITSNILYFLYYRHLMQAEVPPGGPPDVLIVESTFGVMTLPPRYVKLLNMLYFMLVTYSLVG